MAGSLRRGLPFKEWRLKYPEEYERHKKRNKQYLLQKVGGCTEKESQANIDSLRYRRYGLTTEGFQALLASQGGGCAICETPIIGKGEAHIDHCHDTKKVRGLLCIKCNRGIGLLQDSVDILKKAISYLVKE
jgi:hypothetical protein